jgi:phage terminase small subunit
MKKENNKKYNGSQPLDNDRWELLVNLRIKHPDKPNREIYNMAGYKQTGENAKRAYERLWRTNDVLQVRYDYLIEKHNLELEREGFISREKWLSELAGVAFSNGTDYAEIVTKSFIRDIIVEDENGNKDTKFETIYYKDVEFAETKDIDNQKKKAIAGIKKTKEGIEIKTHDKLKALQMIGQHMGWLSSKEDEKDNNDVKAIEEKYGL